LLNAPAGENTRPTADRAKESLFNIISEEVRGARFLDIFCGSGAIGIEALSRGAVEAVFVDTSADAIKCLTGNLTKTKLSHSAEILALSAEKAIAQLSAKNRQFDIIFLDPPYNSNLLPQTLEQISQASLLANGGIIIAETDTNFSHIVSTSTRTYGRTKFLFFNPMPA
jgi:16S rRNA (guanine966-N2)-methyltransferase